MDDDNKGTGPSHTPGTRKGEELGGSGDQPGREDVESTHADRPAGKSTPRMSTSINPDYEQPIDPESPVMPPA